MRFVGEHTRKVTLKKRVVTYNEFNEQIEDWDSNDVTIFAEFFERQAKEGESGGQILVVQDVRCKIRYRSDMDPSGGNSPEADFRIQDDQTTYDVESVVLVGRKKEMRLMLERRDNQ